MSQKEVIQDAGSAVEAPPEEGKEQIEQLEQLKTDQEMVQTVEPPSAEAQEETPQVEAETVIEGDQTMDNGDDKLEKSESKKESKQKSDSERPSCRINRNSMAPLEMKEILQRLDGEGDKKKKKAGLRNAKKELESILNTTHSIKTFAHIDEEKQKFQAENIHRIKEATYQIDIASSQEEDVEAQKPELQFISMCKYSNLIQNDIESVISKMSSSMCNTEANNLSQHVVGSPQKGEGEDEEKKEEKEVSVEGEEPPTKRQKTDDEIPKSPIIQQLKEKQLKEKETVQALDEHANAITIKGDTTSSDHPATPSPTKISVSIQLKNTTTKGAKAKQKMASKLIEFQGQRVAVQQKPPPTAPTAQPEHEIQEIRTNEGGDDDSTNDIANDSTKDSRN